MKILKTAYYVKLSESEKEKKDFFYKRTNEHIERVQDAAKKIVDEYEEYKDLLKQVKNHDNSKFKEPELTPYIELTWQKKVNPKFKTTKEINEATLYHVKNNKHHPEYHLKDKDDENILDGENRDKSKKCVDASLMDDISLIEMVADWQAMSEEIQKNTAREWFNEQKNVRWKFSEKQEKLINKILKVFE